MPAARAAFGGAAAAAAGRADGRRGPDASTRSASSSVARRLRTLAAPPATQQAVPAGHAMHGRQWQNGPAHPAHPVPAHPAYSAPGGRFASSLGAAAGPVSGRARRLVSTAAAAAAAANASPLGAEAPASGAPLTVSEQLANLPASRIAAWIVCGVAAASLQVNPWRKTLLFLIYS